MTLKINLDSKVGDITCEKLFISNLQVTHSPTITILNSAGEEIVRINDGKVVFGENYTPDEASRHFWLSVAGDDPTVLKKEIGALNEKIEQLEASSK